MSEIVEILKIHSEKYKKMMPVDVIKLIYQGEFGGSHMAKNKDKFIEYLKTEYQSAPESNELFEEIGFGYIRVFLFSAKAEKITPEDISEVFFKSAKKTNGSKEGFVKKLNEVTENFEKIGFNFTKKEFAVASDEFLNGDMKPVGHSREYKGNYSPSYRIVLKEDFEKWLNL